MKANIRKMAMASAAVLLTGHQMAAFAGSSGLWTITYGPPGTSSVPTMSEWAMLGLSITLAALAVYSLRHKTGGKPLASVLIALALAFGATSGRNILGQASATPPPQMTNPAGGTVIPFAISYGVETQVSNSSGVQQTVISVSPVSDPTIVHAPTCVAGVTVVQPAQSCWVLVTVAPG